MKKFRELSKAQKVAVVGTGIAVPVVGLGVANHITTKKAKREIIRELFNLDKNAPEEVSAYDKMKLLNKTVPVMEENDEIFEILNNILTELFIPYPTKMLCTVIKVNTVKTLFNVMAVAKKVLESSRGNTNLQDLNKNLEEIIRNIFEGDYLDSDELSINMKFFQDTLDEIDMLSDLEEDDFFENEEAAEPEAKKASGNTDVENKSSSNCFDVFKSRTVKDTTAVPAQQNVENNQNPLLAAFEDKTEEVARKNAITDEEAFEQAKKIYINMPEKFKTEKLNKKYGVESSAEKKSGDETVETTEAKKEEAKAIASEIAETVVDAAEKTLELDNSNQKYPAKKVTKTQSKAPAKKTVRRKTSTIKKEVTVNEQK